MLHTIMPKETETQETIIGFFVTFLSLVTFQLERPGPPSVYANVHEHAKRN